MFEVKHTYHDNGKLSTTTPYRNGVKHGVQHSYFDNGNIHIATPYCDGVKHGIERCSYRNDKATTVYFLYGEQTTYEEYRKHELIEELACLHNE